MQAIANWLVARPQNAVMALAVTVLMPAPQMFSGATIVLVLLARGTRFATLTMLLAGGLLAVISLILGGSLQSVASLAAGSWLPPLLLASVMLAARSLVLTMQGSVIAAVAGLLLFQVLVPDATAFWQPYLDMMEEFIRENGLELNTELLSADVMTVSAVLAFWMLYAGSLLIGNALYRELPGDLPNFGEFRNLDFGRVIAISMALVALLALIFGAVWMSNIAFIVFVMFMMQGLALVHWLYSEGRLPGVAVVAVYCLLPLLQVLLVLVLAIIGYTDAWTRFRHRIGKT